MAFAAKSFLSTHDNIANMNKTNSLEDSKVSYTQKKSSLDKLLEQEICSCTDLAKLSGYLLSLIEKMEWLDDLGDETIELYIEDIEDRIEKISELCKPILSDVTKHYNIVPSILKKEREDGAYIEYLLHAAKLVCDGVKANYYCIDEDY